MADARTGLAGGPLHRRRVAYLFDGFRACCVDFPGWGCQRLVGEVGEAVVPSDRNTVVRSLRARTRFVGIALSAVGLVMSAATSGAAMTQAAPATGLVAAYAFDEASGTTVADASGSGNGGTISGATWTAAGKYGPALVFNGTNAKVTIPDAPSLRLTNAMTLEAWVNPAGNSSAWRDVVYKGDDNYYLEASSTNGGAPAAGGRIGSGGSFASAGSPLATSPLRDTCGHAIR